MPRKRSQESDLTSRTIKRQRIVVKKLHFPRMPYQFNMGNLLAQMMLDVRLCVASFHKKSRHLGMLYCRTRQYSSGYVTFTGNEQNRFISKRTPSEKSTFPRQTRGHTFVGNALRQLLHQHFFYDPCCRVQFFQVRVEKDFTKESTLPCCF